MLDIQGMVDQISSNASYSIEAHKNNFYLTPENLNANTETPDTMVGLITVDAQAEEEKSISIIKSKSDPQSSLSDSREASESIA